jgi:16S rRNA G966 N2-methylase RsmD
LKKGDDLRDFNISPELRQLLGFAVNYGTTSPNNIYTTWAAINGELMRFKKRLSKYIGKIDHWQITNWDYRFLPDCEATWFIDPPYQFGGNLYVENKINYKELSEWCLSRKGEIIVCENDKASCLPFVPLVKLCGQKHKTMEVIYHKING